MIHIKGVLEHNPSLTPDLIQNQLLYLISYLNRSSIYLSYIAQHHFNVFWNLVPTGI